MGFWGWAKAFSGGLREKDQVLGVRFRDYVAV